MDVLIRVKSHYSLGLGTASVADLVARARALSFAALWLTDVENAYGQVELHSLCRATGLRAITGVELRRGWTVGKHPGLKQGRLVLMARDDAGYQSMCQLISSRRASLQSTPAPIDSLRQICGQVGSGKHGAHAGLLVMSDDPDVLEPAVDVVGRARVRALVVRPGGSPDEHHVRAEAERLGVRTMADTDSVFLGRDDWQLHRLLLAVHLKGTIANVDTALLERPEQRMRHPRELQMLFKDLPQAFEETQALVETAKVSLLRPPMPVKERAPLTNGGTPTLDEPALSRAVGASARHLLERCKARLARLQTNEPWTVYQERLLEEVSVIDAAGMSRYFLLLADLVAYARSAGIAMMARGSAVGSLVVHLLDASPIDPIAHKLLFERFLHTRRRQLPDIDLDVCSERREELLQWLRGRFGHAFVAQVGAIHTFQRRAAYRDGLKALGASRATIKQVADALPADELSDTRMSLPENVLAEPWRTHAALFERLIGTPRHIAVHPAGVVISERPLAGELPLELAPKGVLVTQYSAEWVQHAGMVKLDLLGNLCLDELAEVQRWLQTACESSSSTDASDLQKPIPLDDRATLDLLDQGRSIGCFQLESPAVRRVLRQLPIRQLSDVIAATAVVRPGPASGRAKSDFVRRACGLEPTTYWHPAFEEVLRHTHGMLLYEEDITLALATLAGLELPAAEQFRAALVNHQHDHHWLARAQQRLVKRAQQRGFDASVVRDAWHDIARFVAYSFSRAHATSHAILGYQAAFFKVHAPVEFTCAAINHHAGLYPKRSLVAEFTRMGVNVEPPRVQCSQLRASLQPNTRDAVAPFARSVRVGLAEIKHLRATTARRIVAERGFAPFVDLADFLVRVVPNRREQQALFLCGACDELAPLTADAYPWLHGRALARLSIGDVVLDSRYEERIRHELGRVSLQSTAPRPVAAECSVTATHRLTNTFQGLSRVHYELVYLGMHLSDHPLRLLRTEAKVQGCIASPQLFRYVGQRVRLAAIVASSRRVPDGLGVTRFVTLEDEFGLVEATIRTVDYERLSPLLTSPGPYLVGARVEEVGGLIRLRIEELLPFHHRPGPYQSRRS